MDICVPLKLLATLICFSLGFHLSNIKENRRTTAMAEELTNKFYFTKKEEKPQNL